MKNQCLTRVKWTLILTCISMLFLTVPVKGSSGKISNFPLKTTFQSAVEIIEKNTDYKFFFSDELVNTKKEIVLNDFTNRNIETVVQELLNDSELTYSIVGSNIVVKRTPKAPTVTATSNQQQAHVVKGNVKDETGLELIGVSIRIKGTSQGTITNVDGNFELNMPANTNMIEVSYIGYITQEIDVKGKNQINVILKEDKQSLEEVVVVGYGVQKKVNLTGSVATIDFEDQVASRPVTNVSTALAGLSSGVYVKQSSGQPGSDGASITIRGVGSLSGGSGPLVLIDGIQGVLDAVNPSDVASISILKDAAAGAIYGSQAANGVILVTTKSGANKNGKVNVRYSGVISKTSPTNLVNAVTNYADYMDLINESYTNIGQNPHFSQSTIDLWRDKSSRPKELNEFGVPNYVAFPNTNWQDAVFNDKVLSEHNISVDGSSDKISFLLSLGYLNNPGLVDKTGLERYSFRSNISAKITDWLSVGNRTYGSLQRGDNGNFSSADNFLRQTTPGIYPKYKGQYGYPEAPEESATANSILAFLNNRNGKIDNTRINTTFFTSVNYKGFSWDFNLNYSTRFMENNSWTNAVEKVRFSDGTVMSPKTKPSEMTTSFDNYKNYSYTIENILKYNTTISQKHDIGALLGYNEYYYYEKNNSAEKKGLIDEQIVTPGSATDMVSIKGSALDRATRSYFGRINYAYDSKYLFEANLRYDGHARFHKDHRYGLFPSLSGAWRLSEEAFMANSREWLDNLKLRLSWGRLGNANSGEYEYMATYSKRDYSFGNTQVPGLAVVDLPNERISWETSETLNLGVDMNLLSNRLKFEFDVFSRTITDLLYRPAIYVTMGQKNPPRRNVAKMRNIGYEINLGWVDDYRGLTYGVTGNFSYVKNEVLRHKGKLKQGWITGPNGELIYSTNLGDVSDGGTERLLEGHMFNEYYMKDVYKGNGSYYTNDGKVNVNGGPRDGMIRTEADMKWVKDMIDNGYEFWPNKAVAKNRIWYGDYIYADRNGDGIYGNPDDNRFQGYSSNPKYNFGLQAFAGWKGIDFSINLAGAAGFKLYWDASTGYNSTGTRVGYALPKGIAKNHYYYDPENPNDPRTNINAKNPRLTAGESGSQNTEGSSRFLFSGNYLKIKNITVGYSLPKKWIRKASLEQVRFYISGENLHNFTNFPGQDPELGAYPGYTSVKQVAFGLNLTL